MRKGIVMFDETELAARHYLYTLYQSLLGGEPTANLLASIDVDLLQQAYGILSLDEPTELTRAIDGVRKSAEAIEAAGSEYTKAFVGPAKLPASPWESTHVSGDGGLFTRHTLEVRNAYRAEGFLPADYPRVADDHIALECGFLAALAERALGTCETDGDACKRALDASADFLNRHLLKWVGTYADELGASPCAFYGTVAKHLAVFAENDAKRLTAV